MNVGIVDVFASGAVVGRTTTHELGRPSLGALRGAGRPHECVVALVVNLMDWQINDDERSIVSSGLNFTVTPTKLLVTESIAGKETVAKQLTYSAAHALRG